MPAYSLNLGNLLIVNEKPRPKPKYVNGVPTDVIVGYIYRLIDLSNAETLNITLPMEKEFTPQSYVEVINPKGTPYVRSDNKQAALSIKADDIRPIKS